MFEGAFTLSNFYMIAGFLLSMYACVSNDIIQTLGTFLSANKKTPFYYLWAFFGNSSGYNNSNRMDCERWRYVFWAVDQNSGYGTVYISVFAAAHYTYTFDTVGNSCCNDIPCTQRFLCKRHFRNMDDAYKISTRICYRIYCGNHYL